MGRVRACVKRMNSRVPSTFVFVGNRKQEVVSIITKAVETVFQKPCPLFTAAKRIALGVHRNVLSSKYSTLPYLTSVRFARRQYARQFMLLNDVKFNATTTPRNTVPSSWRSPVPSLAGSVRSCSANRSVVY